MKIKQRRTIMQFIYIDIYIYRNGYYLGMNYGVTKDVAANESLAGAAVCEVLDEDILVFTANLFAALGNPTRLKIVELLITGERTVNDVAQTLGIQQPNASLHLATLHRAGITRVAPHGAQRRHSVRGPRIAQIITIAIEFRNRHAQAISTDPPLTFHDEGAREERSDTVP
jgi:ArsR family transcriptional regulator, cadmium/lead-responsive transcriptional repressor